MKVSEKHPYHAMLITNVGIDSNNFTTIVELWYKGDELQKKRIKGNRVKQGGDVMLTFYWFIKIMDVKDPWCH